MRIENHRPERLPHRVPLECLGFKFQLVGQGGGFRRKVPADPLAFAVDAGPAADAPDPVTIRVFEADNFQWNQLTRASRHPSQRGWVEVSVPTVFASASLFFLCLALGKNWQMGDKL